jgi:hypothetical protein
MLAEIVPVKEIRTGDSILLWGQPLKIFGIKVENSLIHADYKDSDGEIHSVRFGLTGLIARILPEPVEVRESWIVSHEGRYGTYKGRFMHEPDAKLYMKDAIEVGESQVAIEHVREIVLSREEVKHE